MLHLVHCSREDWKKNASKSSRLLAREKACVLPKGRAPRTSFTRYVYKRREEYKHTLTWLFSSSISPPHKKNQIRRRGREDPTTPCRRGAWRGLAGPRERHRHRDIRLVQHRSAATGRAERRSCSVGAPRKGMALDREWGMWMGRLNEE